MTAKHIEVQDLKPGDKFVFRSGVSSVIIHNDGTRIHYGWMSGESSHSCSRTASLYSVFESLVGKVYTSKHSELGLTVGVAEHKFKFGDIVSIHMNSLSRYESGYTKNDKLLVTRQNTTQPFSYRVTNESGTYQSWVPEEDLIGDSK
jgi:hypothetical protein